MPPKTKTPPSTPPTSAGSYYEPPSQRQPPQAPSLGPRRRGAPPGNLNALKHGFYTRRLHKRHLSGLETTNPSGLVEEIALIRLFTRRLLESIDPDSDSYQLAEILRVLCLASSAITRVVRAQFLIDVSRPGIDDEIALAIQQVAAEFNSRRSPSTPPELPPSADSPIPDLPDEV
jgi:hypothetical protein